MLSWAAAPELEAAAWIGPVCVQGGGSGGLNLWGQKNGTLLELDVQSAAVFKENKLSGFPTGAVKAANGQIIVTRAVPDGRTDGLRWDLLNDGIGNPKKTKSLVCSHRTPPMMSLGVRETVEQAVRSGFRNILFAVRPEEEMQAVAEYLESLRPVPSPFLVKGKLSPAARRGKKLFEDPQVGCAGCHPAPLFTDQKSHRVGTETAVDRPGDQFDTPSLIECWRTAPYLHDGSAASIRKC